jgi:hypothetical protein
LPEKRNACIRTETPSKHYTGTSLHEHDQAIPQREQDRLRPIEIHRQAALWFRDQEVFDFVGEYLYVITSHSFRTYLLASELKKAGMDWKRTILSRFLSGPALLFAQLKTDPTFKSEEERARAFQERGGGSRATYFNHAKKFHPPISPPRPR